MIIMTALRDDLENHLNGDLFRLTMDKEAFELQSIQASVMTVDIVENVPYRLPPRLRSRTLPESIAFVHVPRSMVVVHQVDSATKRS